MQIELKLIERDSIRVFLFGGLGNQLFQLAAGLHSAEGRPVILDSRFSLVRTQDRETPEIGDLRLPPNVILDRNPISQSHVQWGKLATKYLLASTVNDAFRYQSGIATLASIAVGRSLGVQRIHRSRGVGSDPGLHDIPGNTGIIGYFQSALYANTLKLFYQRSLLLPYSDPPWLASLRQESLQRNVTVLHMRLADYVGSSMHRIATPSYYESALEHIEEQSGSDSVWLFSDQPTAALEALSSILRNRNVRVVPDVCVGASPAQVLTAMSLGSNFIIPGSTFGWWAAFLGKPGKVVVCPTQWFHGAPDPEGLVPLHWERLSDGAQT